FKDKVVFVGARLHTKMPGERKDEYLSPHSSWEQRLSPTGESERQPDFMSGLEIQATMFLNLIRGDWLMRTTSATERGWILLLGILFGYGLVLFRPFVAVGVALLGGAAVVFVSYRFFENQRIWFPWLIVVGAQIPLALICSIIFNSIQLYVQKKL